MPFSILPERLFRHISIIIQISFNIQSFSVPGRPWRASSNRCLS